MPTTISPFAWLNTTDTGATNVYPYLILVEPSAGEVIVNTTPVNITISVIAPTIEILYKSPPFFPPQLQNLHIAI